MRDVLPLLLHVLFPFMHCQLPSLLPHTPPPASTIVFFSSSRACLVLDPCMQPALACQLLHEASPIDKPLTSNSLSCMKLAHTCSSVQSLLQLSSRPADSTCTSSPLSAHLLSLAADHAKHTSCTLRLLTAPAYTPNTTLLSHHLLPMHHPFTSWL